MTDEWGGGPKPVPNIWPRLSVSSSRMDRWGLAAKQSQGVGFALLVSGAVPRKNGHGEKVEGGG